MSEKNVYSQPLLTVHGDVTVITQALKHKAAVNDGNWYDVNNDGRLDEADFQLSTIG